MRFLIGVLIFAFLVLVGLYLYGLTLSPKVRTIEQDAIGAANA